MVATDLAGNKTRVNQVITRNERPTVTMLIDDRTVASTDPNVDIDLVPVFEDAETFVRFDTIFGIIDVHLFDQTPQTMANFLQYVTDGDYTNTIFHRLVESFVLQGGGFEFVSGGTPQIVAIPADPAVLNEPGITNARGTIAMAKLGNNPNSATNQFFFNLTDNSEILDDQNGGFTAFGQIASGAQAVLDQFEQMETFGPTDFDASFPPELQGAFRQGPQAPPHVPLRNNPDISSFPQNLAANNVALINSISVLAESGLTYEVTSSDPTVVMASITGTTLALDFDPQNNGTTGSAMITVRAIDRDGSAEETTFTVNVTGAP
jgi:cyclophilin family peptidyl-prolyl cis-trans isomerase